MTPTLTKVKEAATRRSRLEIIDDAITADEQKLAAARQQFVELADAEDIAVRESKAKDPLASPYQLGSPAQTARADREKLDRSIDGLEKGIAALRAERVIAAREHAVRRLVEAIEEGRDLQAAERAVRIAAGKVLAELAEVWMKLVPVLEQRNALLARVRNEKLLETVGTETEAAARWEVVAGFVVEPVATDFAAFVEQAVEVALAERRDVEAERAEVDAQNKRREAFNANVRLGSDDKPVEFPPGDSGPNPHLARALLPLSYPAPPPKHELELYEAVPDLRDVVDGAKVSGVATRSSTPIPRWPDAA